MPSTFETSLIEQNNQAVLCLHIGKYEEAIKILSIALQTAKRRIGGEARSRSRQEGRLQIDLDKVLFQSPALACDANFVQQKQQQGGQSAYMYHRPIVVPPHTTMRNDYESSVVFGTIVIFNLALSYHLISKGSLEKRSAYLCKAVKLYNLAYNLLITEKVESVLFSMATLNNMGLIHNELCNLEQSQECFQRILSTVMCLIDCGVGGCFKTEYDWFIHNALIFVLPTSKVYRNSD